MAVNRMLTCLKARGRHRLGLLVAWLDRPTGDGDGLFLNIRDAYQVVRKAAHSEPLVKWLWCFALCWSFLWACVEGAAFCLGYTPWVHGPAALVNVMVFLQIVLTLRGLGR